MKFKHAKWPPSDLTPWTLTLVEQHVKYTRFPTRPDRKKSNVPQVKKI